MQMANEKERKMRCPCRGVTESGWTSMVAVQIESFRQDLYNGQQAVVGKTALEDLSKEEEKCSERHWSVAMVVGLRGVIRSTYVRTGRGETGGLWNQAALEQQVFITS